MRITVLCFGPMREYLPPDSDGRRAALELSEPGRVADAVAALGAPQRLVFAVLVDGERAGLDSELHEGAEVTLMPAFTGGETVRR